MLVSSRAESWGQITYDLELDEFEAEINTTDGNTGVSIQHPISAGCLVTPRCNLGCDYCYGNDEALPSAELSTSEWDELFNLLRSWGLLRVDLSGGEPTLREDIGDITRAARAAGLNVVLSTNGLLSKRLDLLPDKLRIHVSIDSGLAEVHEASRVRRNHSVNRGGFERTVNFVRQAIERSHRVRVLTCIGRHNAGGLFALGELLSLVGVPEWNISRILPAGRAQAAFADRWRVDDSELLEQIHDMRKAYPSIRIRYSSRTDINGYFLLVLPDGTLATQCVDGRDKVHLGRLVDMSLEDLQNHPAFDVDRHARKWIHMASEVVGRAA